MSAPIPVFGDRPKAVPTPKLRALVKYPGNIVGTTGIEVTKANGTVTIETDWTDFGAISAIPTSPTSFILTFDSATGAYVLVPSHLLGGAASGIADAPIDGITYARNSAAWVAIAAAGGDYATKATVVVAHVPAGLTYLRIAGYSAPGDGGAALYKRVVSAPSHAGKIQSADGAWWELSELEPNLFQFGGTVVAANNATALQNLVDYCTAKKCPAGIPAGDFTFTSSVSVAAPVVIFGAGRSNARLLASGNFGQILLFTATAIGSTVQNLTIVTNGSTTRCVSVAVDSVAVNFFRCSFLSDLANACVYSNGQNLVFDQCGFATSGSTYAIILDCYNQNTAITNCVVYGPGLGISITDAFSPGVNRVEGTRIVNSFFINTGGTNVEIGNSLFTTITGTALDQASLYALYIHAGANAVTATGCYFGSSQITSATGIRFDANAGSGHTISGNVIAYCGYGINIAATASARVSNVTISNNSFESLAQTALLLDSVLNCTITGNTHDGAAANASWNTIRSFSGGGRYTFDNNHWYAAAPTLFDAGSTYRFGNDTGIVGRNRGVNVAPTTGTNFEIAHGCFTTPTRVLASNADAPQAIQVGGIGPTTFFAIYATSSAPTIHWDAEV